MKRTEKRRRNEPSLDGKRKLWIEDRNALKPNLEHEQYDIGIELLVWIRIREQDPLKQGLKLLLDVLNEKEARV